MDEGSDMFRGDIDADVSSDVDADLDGDLGQDLNSDDIAEIPDEGLNDDALETAETDLEADLVEDLNADSNSDVGDELNDDLEADVGENAVIDKNSDNSGEDLSDVSSDDSSYTNEIGADISKESAADIADNSGVDLNEETEDIATLESAVVNSDSIGEDLNEVPADEILNESQELNDSDEIDVDRRGTEDEMLDKQQEKSDESVSGADQSELADGAFEELQELNDDDEVDIDHGEAEDEMPEEQQEASADGVADVDHSEDFDETIEEHDVAADMLEGQNFNSIKDTSDAFDFADRNYERTSPHWQEVANRQLENLSCEDAELQVPLAAAKERMDLGYKNISDFVNSSNLDYNTSTSNPVYQKLSNDYSSAKNEYDRLNGKYSECQRKIADISKNIVPEMQTSFRGMNDADFQNSYNDYITDRQGNAVPGFGGVCGINETCSIVNQQTGSNMGEADGIKEYVSRGLCETNSGYSNNGGTNAIGRAKFLNDKGLSFQRIEVAKDNGVSFSLDDVARRFNNGESVGLMLKAQDLSQPDLSSRVVNPQNVQTWSANKANHATTVAGFSYGANSQATGVWLNDTGGWAGSNRVYIDKGKFLLMQTNTRGFAVEFSRKGKML